MELIKEIPFKLKDRILFEENFKIPCSWEEFLDLASKVDYQVEYLNGKMISNMGYASLEHEIIVGNLIRILGNLLGFDFKVLGSNAAINIPGKGNNYFNADCTVVDGPIKKERLNNNIIALTNPAVIVEVLSPSTYKHDLIHKKKYYSRIDSLRHILFVDKSGFNVELYTKSDKTKDWMVQIFDDPESELFILEKGFIKLKDIYAQIEFLEGED